MLSSVKLLENLFYCSLQGEIMELLKTIVAPLTKLFTASPKTEPTHELTPFGRQLFWEKRRKEALLREQQNKPK